jgi:hypothetical protein
LPDENAGLEVAPAEFINAEMLEKGLVTLVGKVDEMGAGGMGAGNVSGNVAGFQLPMGASPRKHKIKEALGLYGMNEAHAMVFFRNAPAEIQERFLEALDFMAYEDAAGMVKEQVLREAVRVKIREVVRRKEGGKGYILYAPNKGKKTASKPVGQFTTKLAAKRAELARFPPKDPQKLARLRKQVDKLMKDPKKRAESEHPTMKSKKHETVELLHRALLAEAVVQGIREGLFREEAPASEWDSYISKISDKAIKGDRRFQQIQKRLEAATKFAMAKAVKIIQKQLGGDAKVKASSKTGTTEGGQVYIPFHIETPDARVGPIYLYVENGHPAIEMSDEAKTGLTKVLPGTAKAIRAALAMSGDNLNEVDDVSTVVGQRDAYLGKLEKQIDRMVAGMSPLQISLLKNLLVKKYRGSK